MRPARRRFLSAVAGVGVLVMMAGCTGAAGTAEVAPIGSTAVAPTAAAGANPSTSATGTASAIRDRTPLKLPALPNISLPAAPPATRTDQLAQAMSDSGNPTLQQAIDVYSLSVAPLPGATPFTLPAGGGFSSTNAIALITHFHSELSAAQAAVVDADQGTVIGSIDVSSITATATTPGPTTPTAMTATPSTPAATTPDTTVSTAQPTGLRGPGRALAALAPPPTPTSATPTPSTTTPTPSSHDLALLQATMSDWKAKHPELIDRVGAVQLAVATANRSISGAPNTSPAMDARPAATGTNACLITLYPSYLTAGYDDQFSKLLLAHELFHCIEFTWATTFGRPDWLVEGSAQWAAMDLYRNTAASTEHPFLQWFTNPGTSLGQEGAGQGYNAWPLFETYDEQIGDPYPEIQAMITAGGDTADLLAAGGMDGPIFASIWSSRSIRSTSFPEQVFHLDWPGTDPDFPTEEHDILVPEDARGVGTFSVSVDRQFVHESFSVPFTSDVGVVGVTASGGDVTTRDDQGSAGITDGNEGWFCVQAGGCICPPGQEATVNFSNLDGPMVLSFPAQAATTTANLDDLAWDPDRYCEDIPSTPTGPGDGGTDASGPVGTSNGDPHVTTFDGLLYDFMTLGEFVTAEDPNGGFTVQERHQPAFFGTAISAVAVGDGTHRITFTAADISEDAAITVRADGAKVNSASFVDGDLTVGPVARSARTWTVSWPDGSAVKLVWNYGLFLTVQPSAARAARMVGILGRPDGDFLDDLAMPDGSMASPADHYQAFAQAWWITDTTSLFDYDNGQNTETFRVPPPNRPAVRPPTPQALTSCRDGLGQAATAGEIHSCAFDLTATGQSSLVSAYRDQVDERQSQVQQEPPAQRDPPRIVVGGSSPATSAASSPTATSAPGGSTAPSSSGAVAVTSTAGSMTVSATFPADPYALEPPLQPGGRMHLVQGAVVVAKVNCPTGVPDFDLEVRVALIGSDGNTLGPDAGVCGQEWRLDNFTGAPDEETHVGESYVLIRSTGEYTVSLVDDTSSTLPAPVPITAQITADTAPLVVTGSLPAAGVSKTLAAGSSLVVILQPGQHRGTWAIDGGGSVCSRLDYLTGTFDPGSAPQDLDGICRHQRTVSAPAGFALPLVIFNRDGPPVKVTVRRTG